MIESDIDQKTGERIFYAAVELRLHFGSPVEMPVWVRVSFRDTPDGLKATFGDRTELLPKESESFLTHIAETIEARLAEGNFPLVKLGF